MLATGYHSMPNLQNALSGLGCGTLPTLTIIIWPGQVEVLKRSKGAKECYIYINMVMKTASHPGLLAYLGYYSLTERNETLQASIWLNYALELPPTKSCQRKCLQFKDIITLD